MKRLSVLIISMIVLFSAVALSEQLLEKEISNPETVINKPDVIYVWCGVTRQIYVALDKSNDLVDKFLFVVESHRPLVLGYTFLICFVWWIYYWSKLYFFGRLIVSKKEDKSKVYIRSEPLQTLIEGESYGLWALVFLLGGIGLFVAMCVSFVNK